MKTHTTSYQNTFITVADDCPAIAGEIPPIKGTEKSIANIQFEQLYENPYKFDSDDIIFGCFAEKNKIIGSEKNAARIDFFSKGQPCMRASPLTKRYGWGVHANAEGKIALFGCESEEYKKMIHDPNLKVIKAMKSKK